MSAFSDASFPSDSGRSKSPNTYIVQDRLGEEEMMRLALQDKMLIAVMGGTLTEQKEVQQFRRVLDIGCGTGGWVIETARAYPTLLLTAVDINQKMIEYAKAQAATVGVSERISFHAMDALALPGLANTSFDLVNQRFGSTYLRVWEWPQMMREIVRVMRPGGIIRLTEAKAIPTSNSAALQQMCELFVEASFWSHHIFEIESAGIISHLETFLAEQRCRDIQMLPTTMEYRAGTKMMDAYYQDMMRMFRTFRPFIQKWCKVNKDYDTLYQQMLIDMRKPDFYANVAFSTIWGHTPA